MAGIFDRAWLTARSGQSAAAALRGTCYKRSGFHYPKSVIWKDHLYVGYATNKEDVELTRVPLSSLSGQTATAPAQCALATLRLEIVIARSP